MRAHLLRYLRLRRSQAWLLILAIFAAILAFIPLFNVLSYEFCLALALVASLAAAHLGSVQVAELREGQEGMLFALDKPLPALVGLLGRCVSANLSLLLLPLALISLNALRVKNCDYLAGLAFFGMMPVLSVILASCIGALSAAAIPRPALATLGALLTIALSLAWGLYRFYAAPPVFAYDPFVGYFPGALYDEDVAIQLPFLVFRLYNLAWLAATACSAAVFFDPAALRLRLGRRSPRLIIPAALLLAASVGLFAYRSPLGFAVNARDLAAQLGGRRETRHFTIHHPRELEAAKVDRLAEDHEFRYAQLAALFGTAPERITSYVFRSPAEKRRLLGAGDTSVAKPWRHEIYLHGQAFPHEVLKHELAHVFSAQFGDAWFKVSLRWQRTPLPHPVFNVGLIEGLAVAADWRAHGELTDHQLAAVALSRSGGAAAVERLFGYGFLAGAASHSYTLAGSFCRWLLEQQGPRKLLAAYRQGGAFDVIYGRPLPALLQEWTAFLARVPVPEEQRQLSEEHFRRPSILRRACSHEVANLTTAAEALAQRREFRAAAELYQRTCDFDPDEPRHLLRWMESTAAAGDLPRSHALGLKLLRHPQLTQALERHTRELLGDLQWLSGEREAAAQAYVRAEQLAGAPYSRRALYLKRWSLEQPAEVRDLVQRYLVVMPGARRDPALDVHLAHSLQLRLPRSGLGWFLVAKQLAGAGHFREAVDPMQQALTRGLPTRDFVIEAHRVLGSSQYASGDLEGARATFARWAKLPTLPAGVRLEVLDWLARLHWRINGKVDRAT